MAAITTFLAGLSVMPSHVLAYIRLGTFLMLVMAFSWFYASFFFLAILRVIGPNGNFCQITLPCETKSNQTNHRQYDLDSITSDTRPCSTRCVPCSAVPCTNCCRPCRPSLPVSNYHMIQNDELLLDDDLYPMYDDDLYPTYEDYLNLCRDRRS